MTAALNALTGAARARPSPKAIDLRGYRAGHPFEPRSWPINVRSPEHLAAPTAERGRVAAEDRVHHD